MSDIERNVGLLLTACIMTLSSCHAASYASTASTEKQEETAVTSTTAAVSENVPESETGGATAEAEQSEDDEPQEPAEVYTEVLEYSEEDDADIFPDVDITARDIADPIAFGEKYGNFISRRVWLYFGYSADLQWTQETADSFRDEDDNRLYYLCVAHRHDSSFPFNTQEGIGAVPESELLFTVPISYESGRKYIIGKLHLTERCFDTLCETAPSCYREKDGKLYFSGQEGGNAGWDNSVIIDYEQDGDCITYNCKRIAWEGLDDMPFTITFKYTDGKWLLDDCTYAEGFMDHFCPDSSDAYEDYMDYYGPYA